MTALLSAGRAPGWIILPAAAVLIVAYAVVKDARDDGNAATVVWHLAWSILGLAALGAVVWWIPTVA